MRPVDQLFERYGESHRHPTNKTLHWVCVPLIVWSVLGVLWSVSPVMGYIAIGLAMLFYVWLSLPLAVGMIGVIALMVYSLTLLGDRVLLASSIVFVVAWVGQFIGHRIEGKKPSFSDDVKFLLVGPAWLLGFLYRGLGIRY